MKWQIQRFNALPLLGYHVASHPCVLDEVSYSSVLNLSLSHHWCRRSLESNTAKLNGSCVIFNQPRSSKTILLGSCVIFNQPRSNKAMLLQYFHVYITFIHKTQINFSISFHSWNCFFFILIFIALIAYVIDELNKKAENEKNSAN